MIVSKKLFFRVFKMNFTRDFSYLYINVRKIVGLSKFRQNFAKIGYFAKAFKISLGPLKFRHFWRFDENFASLATLGPMDSVSRFFSPKCAGYSSKCAKKCASLKCQLFYSIFGRFRGG